MTISNLEMKWLSFTKSLRSIGVLLIFVMIPYLAFIIIPIQFILTMVALSNINYINHELKDPYLNSFRSRYLTASIFKLIGSMTVHVGALLLAIRLIIGPIFSPFYLGSFYGWIFSPAAIIFIIGFVIMIIASIIEVGAWDNLKLFIHHNKEMFPERIKYETTTKVENLRSGALSWALGFLIVTIIIGWILQLIGYFGLSNAAERGMKIEPIAPATQDFQPITPPIQKQQPVRVIEFCPMCGARVSEGASYCGECGVKLAN